MLWLSPYPRSRVFAAPRGLGDDRSPRGIIAETLLCGMLVAAVAGGGDTTNSTAAADPPRREVASWRFSNSRETENCSVAVCLVLVPVCPCLSDIFSCQCWVSLCRTYTAGPSWAPSVAKKSPFRTENMLD